MTTKINQEIEAVKTVLSALQPLSPDVRVGVLDYVAKQLQIGLIISTPAREGSSIESVSSPHIEALMRRYGIIRFTF